MTRRRAVLAFGGLIPLLLCRPGRAAARVSPSWMEVDQAAKQVKFHIISGYNANNASLNFNGYHEGGMNMVVPVGWRVGITLFNQDGNFPHSIVVTRVYGVDDMPDDAGREEAAISRAYTSNPKQGTFANKSDSLRFKTKMAGKYWLFCGVPGHGRGGMWTEFEVSTAATAPYVEIAAGVDQGRP